MGSNGAVRRSIGDATTQRGLQHSGDTEADVAAARVRLAPVALGRAHLDSTVEPGTTAQNTMTGGDIGRCLTIGRSVRVCVFVTILNPLPEIAVHIVQPEGVGGK